MKKTGYSFFLNTLKKIYGDDKMPRGKKKREELREELSKELSGIFAEELKKKSFAKEDIEEIGWKLRYVATLTKVAKLAILGSSCLLKDPLTVINVAPAVVLVPLEGVIADILSVLYGKYVHRAYSAIIKDDKRYYGLALRLPRLPSSFLEGLEGAQKIEDRNCVLVTPILLEDMLQPVIKQISQV